MTFNSETFVFVIRLSKIFDLDLSAKISVIGIGQNFHIGASLLFNESDP